VSPFASSLRVRDPTDEDLGLGANAGGMSGPFPASALRERAERAADAIYRLVGVGLAGFVEADRHAAPYELFA